MDSNFLPAFSAIQSNDLETLVALLRNDPTLASRRSARGHPSLLQGLVLEGDAFDTKTEMARHLLQAGADANEALIAACSIDSVEMACLLLDSGAAPDGVSVWSPLEEAIYWGHHRSRDLLLARGASVTNLRTAAGLGRVDLLPSFFHEDGGLKNAGKTAWPFGEAGLPNRHAKVQSELDAKILSWTHSDQELLDNALVYACMGGHSHAADYLLHRGAHINAIPAGFDFAGSALHYAALRGHSKTVDFLLDRGADPTLLDTKVGATASGWADHGGFEELALRLAGREAVVLSGDSSLEGS